MVKSKGMTLLPTTFGETSSILIVVASSEELVKRVESHLRNAGHAIRAAWVSDIELMEDVLRRNPPDMVLCTETTLTAPYDSVVALCSRYVPEMPVLMLCTRLRIEDALTAMTSGSREAVASGTDQELQHLELVVLRELTAYRQFQTLKMTQAKLADFESRHQQLTASTGDAVAHVAEGIVAEANSAFAALLSVADPAELVGQPLIDLVVPEQQTRVKERLRQLLRGQHNGEPLELELLGREGPVAIKAQLILGQQDGELVIEMLIRSELRAAAPDSTIVWNQRHDFLRALTPSPPAAEGKGSLAALFIAIDRFNELERRIGYMDAPDVLPVIAEELRPLLEAGDKLFTFSVSELALIVDRPSITEIERLAEALKRTVSATTVATASHETQVSVSLTVFPVGPNEKPATVLDQLVAEGRQLASGSTGNQTLVLGSTAKAALVEREEARKAAQIRKAIADNRLRLAYQAIASLEGESRSHFEVLLRMYDESGKEFHAAEFIPTAEKFGLMRIIDRWVIGHALTMIAKRAAAQEASTLFVKISEETLKDAEQFTVWLRTQLRARPLNKNEIVFSIQERLAQNHIRKARDLATAIGDLGASMSLEHFGMSSNSIQILEHLPISFIKFDAQFTRKFNEKDTVKRLSELMGVASKRHIKTIICNIEDANAMARLWQLGINFVQGYHVQAPEVMLLSSEVEMRST